MDKSPDAFRTISEVADWLGTPTHVLRFWESRFSQIKPVKRAGGRRYYRPADMTLLGGIKKLLHDDGLTIRGVQKILREQGVKYVSSLSAPVDGEEQEQVEEAGFAQDVPTQPPRAELVQLYAPPAPETPAPEAPEPEAQEASSPDEAPLQNAAAPALSEETAPSGWQTPDPGQDADEQAPAETPWGEAEPADESTWSAPDPVDQVSADEGSRPPDTTAEAPAPDPAEETPWDESDPVDHGATEAASLTPEPTVSEPAGIAQAPTQTSETDSSDAAAWAAPESASGDGWTPPPPEPEPASATESPPDTSLEDSPDRAADDAPADGAWGAPPMDEDHAADDALPPPEEVDPSETTAPPDDSVPPVSASPDNAGGLFQTRGPESSPEAEAPLSPIQDDAGVPDPTETEPASDPVPAFSRRPPLHTPEPPQAAPAAPPPLSLPEPPAVAEGPTLSEQVLGQLRRNPSLTGQDVRPVFDRLSALRQRMISDPKA